MRSRLLSKLELRIASAVEPERSELVAERAAYLARAGEVTLAMHEIAEIRRKSLKPGDSRLSAAINIAEGLCSYYSDMSPLAEDRFSRARAIASLGDQADLVARAASWLALVKYGNYKFADMIRHIDESVDASPCIESSVAARSSLTIALTLHLANRFDLSLPWYRRTHLMAVEDQDEVTISAMLHDMASIWVSNARNEQLGGPTSSDSSRQAFSGVLSTFNFDDLVGISTLSVFNPLLEAQLHSLQKNYSQALSIYQRNLPKLNVRAVGGWRAWLLVDMAWCQLKVAGSEGIPGMLEGVQSMLSACHHVDDRAAVTSRLAQCWTVLGEMDKAFQMEQDATGLWESFSALQAEMKEVVASSSGYRRLEARCPL